MKQGWTRKKLGEVCIVERGSSPRPIDKYFTNNSDGLNWIKIGDTKGITKYIYSTKEKITKEGARQSRFVKEGDFILSNSMSFGNPFIMKTQGYIHDGWFVMRFPPVDVPDEPPLPIPRTPPRTKVKIKLHDGKEREIQHMISTSFWSADGRPISREVRVADSQSAIFAMLDKTQKEFLEFVLSKYIESGVEELDQEKLPILLQNKYQSLGDAIDILCDVPKIIALFIEFQKYLYQHKVA
jgi:hypothetical protein